jgi:hypothetical protein
MTFQILTMDHHDTSEFQSNRGLRSRLQKTNEDRSIHIPFQTGNRGVVLHRLPHRENHTAHKREQDQEKIHHCYSVRKCRTLFLPLCSYLNRWFFEYQGFILINRRKVFQTTITDNRTLEKDSTSHLSLDTTNSKPSRQTTVVVARNALIHVSSPSFALL